MGPTILTLIVLGLGLILAVVVALAILRTLFIDLPIKAGVHVGERISREINRR